MGNKKIRYICLATIGCCVAATACASSSATSAPASVAPAQSIGVATTAPSATSNTTPATLPGSGTTTPDTIRTITRAAHPGFDTRYYPGDAALKAWHDHSPYEWIGYYLVAPCQTGVTWVGRRNAIRDAGYGTAVIFIGEQDWSGPPSDSGAAAKSGGTQCTVANLTKEKGAIDAARADSTAAAEGFANGTTVFLDVEYVATLSPRFSAYITSWVHSMLASGRYVPGVYVHTRNADAVHAIVAAEYAASGKTTDPPFWTAVPPATTAGAATTNPAFDLVTSTPTTSGFPYASIWQGTFNAIETWGGVKLKIDANVATSRDPSNGG